MRSAAHAVIYTDGARSHKTGRGGYAAVILMPGAAEPRIVSGSEEGTTNNRMELRAAIEGLNALEPQDVELVVDSLYVLKGHEEYLPNWILGGWLTSGRKPVKNIDLWHELVAAVKRHTEVTWSWTRGHDGDHFNEMADRIAQRLAGTAA